MEIVPQFRYAIKIRFLKLLGSAKWNRHIRFTTAACRMGYWFWPNKISEWKKCMFMHVSQQVFSQMCSQYMQPALMMTQKRIPMRVLNSFIKVI